MFIVKILHLANSLATGDSEYDIYYKLYPVLFTAINMYIVPINQISVFVFRVASRSSQSRRLLPAAV